MSPLVGPLLGLALAAPDPRLAPVFADRDARRDRVAGVTYVLEGDLTYLKGRTQDHFPPSPERRWLPPTDVTLKRRRMITFDFPRERYRIDADDECYVFPTGRRERDPWLYTFDGRVHKAWNRRAADGEGGVRLWIDTEYRNYAGFDALVQPLFVAHGNLSCGDAWVKPGRIKLRPDPAAFTVRGEATHDGRRLLVLRTNPGRLPHAFEEYWVEPARKHVIVRAQWYSADELQSDLTIWYQRSIAGWLPERWEETGSDDRGPTDVTRVRVTQLTLDAAPPDARFDIPPQPGLRFFGDTTADATPVEAEAPPEPRRGWWWAGAVAGVVVAAMALWRVRRSRRHPGGRP